MLIYAFIKKAKFDTMTDKIKKVEQLRELLLLYIIELF